MNQLKQFNKQALVLVGGVVKSAQCLRWVSDGKVSADFVAVIGDDEASRNEAGRVLERTNPTTGAKEKLGEVVRSTQSKEMTFHMEGLAQSPLADMSAPFPFVGVINPMKIQSARRAGEPAQVIPEAFSFGSDAAVLFEGRWIRHDGEVLDLKGKQLEEFRPKNHVVL